MSNVRVKCHPTLGILVGTDGHVMRPSCGVHSANWTVGWNNDGYRAVNIYGTPYKIHRLVAETFIPNPDSKPQVDHINRNRSDNRLENLRWVDACENQRNTEQHDRVDARGGTHKYENEKLFSHEKYIRRDKAHMKEQHKLWCSTHKRILFSDKKFHAVTNSEAIELRKLPVKERIWK